MASSIFVIRHAEKPPEPAKGDPPPPPFGVGADGTRDDHSLIPPGWQRAGALARLFAPRGPFTDHRLATPGTIFASGPNAISASLRPRETVQPLADLLGLAVNQSFGEGEEAALVNAAIGTAGVVLIAWHHEKIPEIAGRILGSMVGVPAKWKKHRFDLIWAFAPRAPGWQFEQVPQMLLAGDVEEPISLTDA